MRRLVSFLVIMVCGIAARAQEKHRFAGYVQMPGASLSSYYLDIVIKDKRITGYSITDYTGGNRLKASVSGRMATASEMYIEETGSLDEKRSSSMTYCYFSAHLKLAVTNGQQRWSGPFESRQADGTPCRPMSGIMTVIDNAPPLDPPKGVAASGMKVQQEMPKTITPPAAKPVRPPTVAATKPVPRDTPKPAPVPAPPPPKPRPVVVVAPPKAAPPPPKDTNNCLRSIEWSTDSLVFDIWDGWTIDGDVVSLVLGNRRLLDRAKLSEEKQRFSLPLKPGLNILEILLHEEGFDAPNTPNLTLYEADRKHELNVSGKAGETARICIFRK